MASLGKVLTGRFETDHETLSCVLYGTEKRASHSLLSLHGAGPSGKDRIGYICEFLQLQNVESFAFDFSGHGESTGTLRESSLRRRASQAKAAYDFMPNRPNILVGTSMGAHVSLMLMTFHEFSHLILFCPALYGNDVIDIPFDERFTNAIRQPGSFENSSALEVVRQFEGKTLLFMGTEDKIIPPRVVELYEEARRGKDHKTVWLEECEHVIHGWAMKNDLGKQRILNEVAAVISL